MDDDACHKAEDNAFVTKWVGPLCRCTLLPILLLLLDPAGSGAAEAAQAMRPPRERSGTACDSGPPRLGVSPPPLAYRTAAGGLVQIAWPPLENDGTARVARDGIEATLQRSSDGQWELRLTARTARVEEVRFPWWPASSVAEAIADGWFLYLSTNSGAIAASADLRSGLARGCDSPGVCVSPILIWATDHEGFLVAGTTWPPRHLQVVAGLGGFGLTYPQPVAAGDSVVLRTLLNTACVVPGRGREPWRDVLAPYLAWRRQQTEAANLVPVVPDWLANADGWLNVQLENMPAFDPQALERLRTRVKPLFGWVQFWGQMSNYAGRRELAVPPLGPLEPRGCCILQASLHRRYTPALPQLIARAAAEGRVGVYVQPGKDPLFDEAGRPTPALGVLRAWLKKNREELGTNATYVDRIGNQFYGDPLSVARFIGSELPPGAVIEYPEDLYPAAYLMSGSLSGGSWEGRPGNSPEALGKAFRHGTFPRLGRYLVGDRIVFMGQSNTDIRWWGPEQDYWGERQAFLLGAKFDTITPFEGSQASGPVDEAIDQAVAERRRVGWWEREPVYLDREGIYDLPADVDVRRFRDRSGQDLLVIDNWKQRTGVTFSFNGRKVTVPVQRLSILASTPRTPRARGLGMPGRPDVRPQ